MEQMIYMAQGMGRNRDQQARKVGYIYSFR